jgi:hypothetical protein
MKTEDQKTLFFLKRLTYNSRFETHQNEGFKKFHVDLIVFRKQSKIFDHGWILGHSEKHRLNEDFEKSR